MSNKPGISKEATVKREPSAGSLTNMPNREEMAKFEKDEKPALIAAIRKAHWQNKQKFQKLKKLHLPFYNIYLLHYQ